jgi:hypothetical protein
MQDKKQKLMNQIDRLDRCISELEITANNFYEPQGELLKGWNLLLSMRDKLTKFRDKHWQMYDKLK